MLVCIEFVWFFLLKIVKNDFYYKLELKFVSKYNKLTNI